MILYPIFEDLAKKKKNVFKKDSNIKLKNIVRKTTIVFYSNGTC